jgi:hypothetical protein
MLETLNDSEIIIYNEERYLELLDITSSSSNCINLKLPKIDFYIHFLIGYQRGTD